MKRFFITAAVLTAITLLAPGCSNKVSIEDGKTRIAALAARGVPERHMSGLKVYLHEMETAQQLGNGGRFRLYQDSLTTALAEFEARMDKLLEESGPFMDSLRRACDEKIAQLKGLHAAEAEKGKAAVDSLMKIESQKLHARYRLEAWSSDIDTLIMMQHTADSLRGLFVGRWANELESNDPSFKLLQRNEIEFRANGTLYKLDGRKGSGPGGIMEDALFESRGTWDLLGSVAHQYVTNEKMVRQIIQNIDPNTGKMKRLAQTPYDSAITDKSRDNYISWDKLNKDYQRLSAPAAGTRRR